MRSLADLRSFAVERHAGQLYGGKPYVVHLDAVHAKARHYGLGPIYERAAYGHDLLDDTSTVMPELVEGFGAEEAALIHSVSGPGHNRTARRRETIARLHQHPRGINLKLIDRQANLEQSILDANHDLVKMYLGERAAYAPLFELGDSRIQADLAQLYLSGARLLALDTFH